jgi:hypothetical protein
VVDIVEAKLPKLRLHVDERANEDLQKLAAGIIKHACGLHTMVVMPYQADSVETPPAFLLLQGRASKTDKGAIESLYRDAMDDLCQFERSTERNCLVMVIDSSGGMLCEMATHPIDHEDADETLLTMQIVRQQQAQAQ